MSREVLYLLLIFSLLVIPRALQRMRIPAPLTSLAFGVAGAVAGIGLAHDEVIALLATLGVAALFLFAGLEVEPAGLRRGLWPLLTHLSIRALSLVLTGWVAWYWLGFGWQASALLALALLTPSTGFILDSLARLGLDEEERFWVTSKAVAGEMLALAAMFVVLLAGSPVQLGLSVLALLGLLIGLPLLLLALGRWVAPHAPGSEFSLLVMVGVLAAYVTYRLGVYYLVGAFIAGLTARLLRQRLPLMASADNLHAVRLFASFFVPFYFFHAGLELPMQVFSMQALLIGLALTAVLLPLRVVLIWLQRRVLFRARHGHSRRVAVALTPTLIFTLILASILHMRFALPDAWYGGLLLYTALNTALPSLLLHVAFDVDPAAQLYKVPDATDTRLPPGLDPVVIAPSSAPESDPPR